MDGAASERRLLAIRRHWRRFIRQPFLGTLRCWCGSRPLHRKRKLVRPQDAERWSMTTLRDKLVKIGAKVVRHGRYVTFQLAEVVVPRHLFADILRRIDRLRAKPAPK